MTVIGPDGDLWSAGGVEVRDAVVGVDVRPLDPAGRYTVNYRVTSADGHVVIGSRAFTVTAPGTGSPGVATGPVRPDSGVAIHRWRSGADRFSGRPGAAPQVMGTTPGMMGSGTDARRGAARETKERPMADPQNGPEDNAGATSPAPAKKVSAEKTPAKKTPAKKAAAKKAAAKKVPAKKAAATKAAAQKKPGKKAPAKVASKAPPSLTAKPSRPALEPAPPHAALPAGGDAHRDAPSTTRPAPVPAREVNGGHARLPVTIVLAAIGLVAVVLNRFRRG